MTSSKALVRGTDGVELSDALDLDGPALPPRSPPDPFCDIDCGAGDRGVQDEQRSTVERERLRGRRRRTGGCRHHLGCRTLSAARMGQGRVRASVISSCLADFCSSRLFSPRYGCAAATRTRLFSRPTRRTVLSRSHTIRELSAGKRACLYDGEDPIRFQDRLPPTLLLPLSLLLANQRAPHRRLYAPTFDGSHSSRH